MILVTILHSKVLFFGYGPIKSFQICDCIYTDKFVLTMSDLYSLVVNSYNNWHLFIKACTIYAINWCQIKWKCIRCFISPNQEWITKNWIFMASILCYYYKKTKIFTKFSCRPFKAYNYIYLRCYYFRNIPKGKFKWKKYTQQNFYFDNCITDSKVTVYFNACYISFVMVVCIIFYYICSGTAYIPQ